MGSKIFEQVQVDKPRYSGFDLSHEKKLSCNMGELIPIFLSEVVPGDQFKVSSEVFLRMAPMVAPIMHRVDVYVHYFFVPNRLSWLDWEDFITGGVDGTGAASSFPTIQLNTAEVNIGTLADYLGIPDNVGTTTGPTVSRFPFLAYQQVWNEYYRDENLSTSIEPANRNWATISDTNLTTLRQRCWEKDYFTSALPWAQRGTAISLPIDVLVDQSDSASITQLPGNVRLDNATGNPALVYASDGGTNNDVPIQLIGDQTEFTINELRRTSALQRWAETSARTGYRYVETIRAHFGVKTSDGRLQRPEYLGGGRQPVHISEVLNTSATTGEPQGNMAGHGVSVGQSNTFKRRFEEHGYVIGIMSVLPRTAYQQGIERHWWRSEKEDFYWPEFANLGEQEIYNKEIFYDWDTGTNDDVFGYQQRYAEYKYMTDTVHGEFKSTLYFWHMGRIFNLTPALNESFVESDPTTRIFAVDDSSDHLWVQVYNKFQARRPMPFFSDPRLN